MPRLALALLILWFVSLFVFRTIVQWRQTGSTGIKGFHGRVGSLSWLAGATASLQRFVGILARQILWIGRDASDVCEVQ